MEIVHALRFNLKPLCRACPPQAGHGAGERPPPPGLLGGNAAAPLFSRTPSAPAPTCNSPLRLRAARTPPPARKLLFKDFLPGPAKRSVLGSGAAAGLAFIRDYKTAASLHTDNRATGAPGPALEARERVPAPGPAPGPARLRARRPLQARLPRPIWSFGRQAAGRAAWSAQRDGRRAPCAR